MSNWFASIGQATSGINAAQYSLNVVSQNISNADTDGYTRQQAQQVSADGTIVSSLMMNGSQNTLSGTRVASVDRMTDPVLNGRVLSEHAKGAAADTTATTMTGLEQIFPEPGTDGLSSSLDTFWQSWGTLANNPGDSGTRTSVLTAASAVTTNLNSLSASLSSVVSDAATNLNNDVSQANTAAAQLATLNSQIAIASATGQNANNLLDQRDQALDSLGKLVGGTSVIQPNGTATVTVGGQALVSGTTVSTLGVNASGNVTVAGTAVTLTGGSASSRVTALTTTLPGYQSQLDAVANAVISAGNSIQSGGYDLNGNAGVALFSGSGAAGITVSMTNASQLAASSTSGGNLDGSNALAASQRGAATNGPDALYRTLVAGVGSASATAQQVQTTQDAVVSNVDSLKASISGVSYDDEVSNLLMYQHAFQASSRVLTTLDSMLDTLINHTGAS
jgi:flagellar hook-associated protein 1 FlgK